MAIIRETAFVFRHLCHFATHLYFSQTKEMENLCLSFIHQSIKMIHDGSYRSLLLIFSLGIVIIILFELPSSCSVLCVAFLYQTVYIGSILSDNKRLLQALKTTFPFSVSIWMHNRWQYGFQGLAMTKNCKRGRYSKVISSFISFCTTLQSGITWSSHFFRCFVSMSQ